jgi:tRNA uridine 5-carbamoylmethylation protein Kti12
MVNNNDHQPTVYMFVGVPGSGKSTYISETLVPELLKSGREYVILSTDDFILMKAREEGKKYHEVFDKYAGAAQVNMFDMLKRAVAENKEIIWDQTNMSTKIRAKKLLMVPPNYRKVCLVFRCEDKTLTERLDNRSKNEGKFISADIVDHMKANYEVPKMSEGFDEVKQFYASH